MTNEDVAYSLTYHPWMIRGASTSYQEREVFERGLYRATRTLFQLLRSHPTLSPHIIVSPELGCLSAAELALLWIQRSTFNDRRRQARFNAHLTPEQQDERRKRKKELDKRVGKRKKKVRPT